MEFMVNAVRILGLSVFSITNTMARISSGLGVIYGHAKRALSAIRFKHVDITLGALTPG